MTRTKAEGYYPVTLRDTEKGARTVHLYYTWQSLAYLEDALGVPLAEVTDVLSQGRIKNVALLLHAGLLHLRYDWTLDDVMGMVPLGRMAEINEVVLEAFNASMVDEKTPAPAGSKKKAA